MRHNGDKYVNTGINLKGPRGAVGPRGLPGKDGITPHIGENGNWYIGEQDTGNKAALNTDEYVTKEELDETMDESIIGDIKLNVANIDSRLQQVEGLAELSVEGGQIGIASATDFTNRTTEGDLKIPTVGAILNGADDDPTAGSDNLVTSGGVAEVVNEMNTVQVNKTTQIFISNGVVRSTTVATYSLSDFFYAYTGVVIKGIHREGGGKTKISFYDSSFTYISSINEDNDDDIVLSTDNIPEGAVYFRANLFPDTGKIIYKHAIYNLDDVKTLQEVKTDTLELQNSIYTEVKITPNAYLTETGAVVDFQTTAFRVTDFCPVVNGISVINTRGISGSDYTFLCFYDNSRHFISSLQAENSTPFNYVLSNDVIPEGAVYFRATVSHEGYVDYKIKPNYVNPIDVITRKEPYDLFDYESVLHMDRYTLRSIIENSSNGRYTVLWDDDGYPSLMYKIPKISIGSLAPNLGELTDIHPAFIVHGNEVDCIYAAVFMTSVYNGHYVSWFGLSPEGRITMPQLRTNISNKGDGWHLETLYERSLIVLLTMNYNSPTPTGNTMRGMSHVNTWEFCQLADKRLPGSMTSGVGIKWINGTQPSAWSHNKEMWGIQDVIGGFHEICDLMKLVNGKIYIAADNNYFKKGNKLSTFENTWIDTGAAFDYIDGKTVLNTSVTNPMIDITEPYNSSHYNRITCTENYDSLSIATRKKLSLLLMAPRLSSLDDTTVLPLTGRFGVGNQHPLCYGVFGGAEEYVQSGLGSQITGYPIDDNEQTGHNAHSNMGSRMFYIP